MRHEAREAAARHGKVVKSEQEKGNVWGGKSTQSTKPPNTVGDRGSIKRQRPHERIKVRY
jgi:hypothetical protein